MATDGLQAQLDALFLEELQDNVRTLTDGIAVLEQDPTTVDHTDVVRQLFRAAHSLKGAAHSAGVTSAVRPCHRLEELLAEVQGGDRPVDADLIAALLADVDALSTIELALRADARHEPTASGDAGPSVTAGPAVAAGSGAPIAGRARVAVGRLDQLVTRTGALVSATEQVGVLAADVAAASIEATATERRRRVQAGARATPAEGRGTAVDVLTQISLQLNRMDRELRRLVSDVADTAQQLRLQPFSDVATGLDRSVRELSRATQTEARLVISGGDVQVDRDIGDAIREPLLHLLRNAVDHGLESPDQRTAAGKPAVGTVHLSAVADGTWVSVMVQDDGAGLDMERLRESARRLGMELPDDDAELLFVPGVSTAPAVTAVSGRGVGLDAVRDRIESLGGTMQVGSHPGRGTQVSIQVPRSLAVLRVALVQSGDQVIAIPTANVRRLHRLQEDAVEHLEERLSVAIAEDRVPAVPLSVALGLGETTQTPASLGIGVEVVGEVGVLIVDDVDTELDVVVQPLPARVGAVAGVLGAAVLPSGRTALIVNPSAVLRTGLAAPVPAPVAAARTHRSTVLLAEDSLTTRALERSILETAGYDVIVAADGAEAWELLADDRRRGGGSAARSVDVVVSDVDMPRMGGIELCRAIRSSIHLADLPVVLVTSLSREEDRQRGLDAGANAYIVKSAFEQRMLLDAVGRLV